MQPIHDSPRHASLPRRNLLRAAISAVLLLAACGGDDPATEAAIVDEAAAGEADDSFLDDEEADPEDLGGDPDDLVITFWHGLGGDMEIYIDEELAQRYSEQTDGIVINPVNRGTYEEVLNASILAAGTDAAPHVVQGYVDGTQMARDSGVFVPVHEADSDDLFVVDEYLDAAAVYYTDESGEFYSAPWNSSGPLLYYNSELFEEAGLDPEDPPQTHSEMLDACESVVSETDLDACYNQPIVAWFIHQGITQQGELITNNENGRAGPATETYYDSDAAVEVLTWWGEMYDAGYWVTSGERWNWDESRSLMAEEDVAITLDSSAYVGAYQEDVGDHIRTAFMPVADDASREGVKMGGASLYLADGHSDEETQAALEFINWMSEPEQDSGWHQFTGYYPIRKETRDQLADEGWFDENPNYLTAVEQLEATEVTPATRGSLMGPKPELKSIVLDAAEAVWYEGADPAEALAQTKERADTTLSEYQDALGG